MRNKERVFLLATFGLIGAMVVTDLITDFDEGVPFWHVFIEASAGLMAIIGVIFVLKNMLNLRVSLSKEKLNSAAYKREAEQWRSQAKEHIDGVSLMIENQLSAWGLTPAEKQLSFLLLKGFSLVEIGEFRNTSENTVRTQLSAIYAKAGLKNRAEFAAFFLEDLLPGSNVKA